MHQQSKGRNCFAGAAALEMAYCQRWKVLMYKYLITQPKQIFPLSLSISSSLHTQISVFSTLYYRKNPCYFKDIKKTLIFTYFLLFSFNDNYVISAAVLYESRFYCRERKMLLCQPQSVCPMVPCLLGHCSVHCQYRGTHKVLTRHNYYLIELCGVVK